MIITPIVFFFMATDNWHIGLPVFLFAAFTDALDGTTARMRKQITAWGTLFDPLADKILIGGVLFIFILKYIDIYIGGTIIVLEMIIVIASWLHAKNGIVVSACKWGKAKMLFQVLGVSLIISALITKSHNLMIIAEWTLILSIGFAIWNIVDKIISPPESGGGTMGV
jgi:CDP-diacylglycerol--glycerol-3-phosphate 3-phosphatidyltransferase